jgi:gamma-glutamylcysteine synthetase
MLLKTNIEDESHYWVTLAEQCQIGSIQLQPGTAYRLSGAATKTIYSCCATITPALIEA